MKGRFLLAALVAIALSAGFPASGAAIEGIGVPENVVSVTKETSYMVHPGYTTDYNGTASTADDRADGRKFAWVNKPGNLPRTPASQGFSDSCATIRLITLSLTITSSTFVTRAELPVAVV